MGSGLAVAAFGSESPTTDNPTAIYYNPAGIVLKPETRLFVDLALSSRWASYTREPGAISSPGTGTPGDAFSANAGTAKLHNVQVSSFFGASSTFGTRSFAAGVAYYAPFGGQGVWGQNSRYADHPRHPGADDGVQRWQTIEGKIGSTYLTGAAAFKIPHIGLNIGVTGSAIRSQVDTVWAANADGTDDLVDASSGALKEGRRWLKTSGWQGGFSVGAIWTWQQSLWIGASYTSQPNVVGGMTLKGTLHSALGGAAATARPVELTQTFPEIVRLGVRIRASEKVELRLVGNYARWSVFDRQCVLDASVAGRRCNFADAETALRKPEAFGADDGAGTAGALEQLPRFWKDAGGARVSASYQFAPKLEGFVGGGFETSAARPATLEVALMDMHNLIFYLGARWQVVQQFAVMLTISDIAYFTVDTRGKSVLHKFRAPTTQPAADGIYRQNFVIANLSLDASF